MVVTEEEAITEEQRPESIEAAVVVIVDVVATMKRVKRVSSV